MLKLSCSKNIKRDTLAVPPALAVMLLVVIILVIVTGILAWSIPMIQSAEREARYRTALACFENLDKNIELLIREDINTMRTTRITIHSGSITIRNNDECWVISYMLTDDVDVDIIFYDFWSRFFRLQRTDGEPVDDYFIDIFWLSEDYPPDLAKHPSSGTVAASNDLTEATRIIVYDETYTTPIAEAWVFGIDTITYTMSGPMGTFTLRAVNGGISSNYPSGKSIVNSPVIVDTEYTHTITLYMIQLNPIGATSGAEGNYELTLLLREREINIAENVRNLRVTIYGAYNTSWYNHLTAEAERTLTDISLYTGFIMDGTRDCVIYQAINPSNPGVKNQVNVKLVRCVLNVDMALK
jgi:Tfp pilus assembly major pilin PilA